MINEGTEVACRDTQLVFGARARIPLVPLSPLCTSVAPAASLRFYAVKESMWLRALFSDAVDAPTRRPSPGLYARPGDRECWLPIVHRCLFCRCYHTFRSGLTRRSREMFLNCLWRQFLSWWPRAQWFKGGLRGTTLWDRLCSKGLGDQAEAALQPNPPLGLAPSSALPCSPHSFPRERSSEIPCTRTRSRALLLGQRLSTSASSESPPGVAEADCWASPQSGGQEGPRMCISDRVPGDADAAGPRTTLEDHRSRAPDLTVGVQRIRFQGWDSGVRCRSGREDPDTGG